MQERLRLNKRQRVLPGRNTGGEKQQDQAIGSPEGRTFDLPLEHDQLLTHERVFSDQLRFPSGTIACETADEAMLRRRGPGDEAGLEQMAGGADDPLDGVRELEWPRCRVLRVRRGLCVPASTEHADRRTPHSSSNSACSQMRAN